MYQDAFRLMLLDDTHNDGYPNPDLPSIISYVACSNDGKMRKKWNVEIDLHQAENNL